MQITKGKIKGAKKILIYGPEGIGKSTFASQFPDPVFIDTEGSTKELDVARLPIPASWTTLKESVRYVTQHPEVCRTLVVDTLDWAEKMCVKSVCDAHQWEAITDPGYGNGYTHVYNEFGKLLNLLEEVINAGINVVLTAHASLRKFEQPDERGAYDRWALKLIDTPKCSIAHMVMEWVDAIFFANYKTIVITDSKTKKTKAQGGTRVMYTTHHSCWDAKNRYGLSEELPFEYASIRAVIEEPGAPAQMPEKPERRTRTDADPGPKAYEKAEKAEEKPAKASAETPKATIPEKEPVQMNLEEIREQNPVQELDPRIPKVLRDLMILDNIDEWDIVNFATSKGFVPFDTKIWEYETVNPGIIEGLFVAQWTKVRDQIRQARKNEEIPF